MYARERLSEIAVNAINGLLVDGSGAIPKRSRMQKVELKISQFIPVQTVSELNTHQHFRVANRRHQIQKDAVRKMMPRTGYPQPCVVRLSRVGYRSLDTGDNLPASLKWIRDQLSELIVHSYDKPGQPYVIKKACGRNDDDPRIVWEYSQDPKHPQTGVRIDIYEI